MSDNREPTCDDRPVGTAEERRRWEGCPQTTAVWRSMFGSSGSKHGAQIRYAPSFGSFAWHLPDPRCFAPQQSA
jgi:hypothetical protein